ncbi:MAG: anthranilate phosphoribosyltransferase [Rhodospirillaceae bacterium]|mgnify:FL=1|jgi:anthranilate phosphoribosyltransferase|nr:anthranilate phosphoribosyltransferase [Rhodospirillaceae bacterium]MBT4118798.1 anthranilate phosphoribosyltransferase [Rhodospirillaceae bacterium]MBT4671510.1 anthranilate phosphoribosyltransferase [Rhodospirillaceae bacterium]MBT4719863.1 anthranilate phosphoribosyltransferase [Rhodospirillaceae bacterium]MBT4751986.1 anthranilate phosphoribosyltransferase [Rhodospirillaceae bacterium]
MSDAVTDLKAPIAKLAAREHLSADEAQAAFNVIMSGDATPAQIGGFLMALRVNGESVDEITGAARAMRAKMTTVAAPANAMDVVGTGGDGTGTYNISTGAAIVVAGAGIPVAKHGNRALSSKSGAADALQALGLNNEADFSAIERAIAEANIGFLMAPRHHSAMRHVAGARVELATRTIFNLLGPISNPAGVSRQLTGVFDRQWVRPLAETLSNLGSEAAWVMHGADGSDELTTTGVSYVASLKDGAITEFEIEPEEAGLPRAAPEDLKGGEASKNAAAITQLLAGEPGPYRDIVLYNAGAALIVAGVAGDITDGVALAKESIDSGKARQALEKMLAITADKAT